MAIPRGDGKTTSQWYTVDSEARLELLRGVVVRLYYSRATAAIYVAIFLASAVLLCITLGMDTPLRDAPFALLFLEGLVTFSLFMEVVLRAIVLGSDYLKSWSNLLDALVAIVSASLMFLAAPRASQTGNFETQKEDVELSQSLIMLRTMVQFGRLLLIAKSVNRSRQAHAGDDVTFSKLMGEDGLDIDLDFGALQERELQARHRAEDFGL